MTTSPYSIEIDGVDKAGWDQLITQFDDATIYQTWDYGLVRRGAGNISQLVLKRDGEVLGCCLVTLRRLPFFNVGIAYVVWGPLWRKKGIPSDPEVFLHLIQGLKKEYAVKQGLLLRISSNATGDHRGWVKDIMEREGLERSPTVAAYRTLRMDLSPPLDDLRKKLLQKWRNHLNKAEKSGLTVVEGSKDELYGTFLLLMRQMLARKKFTPGVDYQEYRLIYENLPEHLKMRVAVCESQGEPISVAICSAIGDTGIYILGATGDKGEGLNGAYLLHWRLIQWLKQRDVRWYDLGGIDQQNNPGVYDFKLGIAGKNSFPEEFLGEFHGCFAARARLAKFMLGASNFLKRKR